MLNVMPGSGRASAEGGQVVCGIGFARLSARRWGGESRADAASDFPGFRRGGGDEEKPGRSPSDLPSFRMGGGGEEKPGRSGSDLPSFLWGGGGEEKPGRSGSDLPSFQGGMEMRKSRADRHQIRPDLKAKVAWWRRQICPNPAPSGQ